MRRLLPEACLLPSRSVSTPSFWPIFCISCSPLKENEEVLPGTCKPSILLNAFMSVSGMPVAKCSLFFAGLKSSKGRTATEFMLGDGGRMKRQTKSAMITSAKTINVGTRTLLTLKLTVSSFEVKVLFGTTLSVVGKPFSMRSSSAQSSSVL